jgi:WD40 repeat protein
MKQNINPYPVLASTIAEVLPVYAGWRRPKQAEQEMCPRKRSYGTSMTRSLSHVLFPTLFRVVILSLGICFVMSSCAKAAKEEGKIIAFEKDIDLHISFLSCYVPFVWSPDSRYIAFSKGVYRIGIVDIKTDEVRDISGFRNNTLNKYASLKNLAWSPDGELLAASTSEELWIVRVADGKLINKYSIRDLPPDSPVQFSRMEFSEDSKKLLIASLWSTDYALLNSFDMETNTLTPLLYPLGKPLVPPPGFEKWTAKRIDPEDFRLTRYKGHLYYTAVIRRLQEFWNYAQTFPRGIRNELDVGGNTAMPVMCMIADLGDGKETRSVKVLNFPEYTLKPGIQLQDQSECLLSKAHYYPQANTLVVLRNAPSTQSADGSWQWSKNSMFETVTLTHQSLTRFGEYWSSFHSNEVLHPFKPFLLCSQQVPIDEKLRQAYLSDMKLRGKVPIAVDLVVWHVLTGREIDRISRHQSYLLFKNSIPLGLATEEMSISPDGKHFTYYQGGGNLLPLYKINVKEQ